MDSIFVGDPHFGKRNFSKDLFKEQMKFWNEIVKTANEKNLPIISTGDLFDNRINMDINFFNIFVDEFIGLLKKYNVTFYNVLGNHDIYFKDTRKVNLVKYLNKFYDKIHIIEEVTHLDNITFVPWIIDKEKDIPKDYREIVVGHFEFSDIDRYVKGNLSLKTFEKAKLVISGHYHNSSKKGNVIYIGTPYQLDWSDYKQKKGFYILENNTFTFIENKVSKKFIKLKYDENFKDPLIVSGYEDYDLYFSDLTDELLEILKNNNFKFFINFAKDKNYQKVIYRLSESGLKFEVINNVIISEIIEVDYKEKNLKVESEKDILENIPEKFKDLIKEINEFIIQKEVK